jgi:hypothetical protein
MLVMLAKYNTQTAFPFPMVKRGVVDLAVSADWTPATGDTKVTKDGGNVANTTNNPAAIGGTGSALWTLTLTATELSCADATVQIVDSATKAVEDQVIKVYTFGNASAKYLVDFSDTVRFGLTAMPNVASGSAGAIIVAGTGTAALNVTGGRADADVLRINGNATSAANHQKATALFVPFTVTNAGISPTTTQFEASDVTTATADFYVGRRIIGLTGNRTYEAAQITAYSLQSGRGRFTVTAMTGAFANGDTGLIV